MIIEPDDLCPCDSQRKAHSCCLRPDGRWWVNRRRRPPLLITGLRNRKCYAKALADCAPKISREHFISKRLLKSLGPEFDVSGFPWQTPGTKQRISSKSLTAKCLCARHNSALSGLDNEAARFFRALAPIPDKEVGLTKGEDRMVLVSGDDLEDWMLKVLVGTLSSGNWRKKTTPVTRWDAPDDLVQLLFAYRAEWPQGAGLYVQMQLGETFSRRSRIEYGPIFHSQTGILIGGQFRIVGFRMWLFFSTIGPGFMSDFAPGAVHRPELVELREDGQEHLDLILSFTRPRVSAGAGQIHAESVRHTRVDPAAGTR